MNEPTAVPASQLIAKLVVLWIALLVLPFTERTLLGAQSLHVDWWKSHSPNRAAFYNSALVRYLDFNPKIKNIHWHDKTPFFKGGRTWFAVVVRATSSS